MTPTAPFAPRAPKPSGKSTPRKPRRLSAFFPSKTRSAAGSPFSKSNRIIYNGPVIKRFLLVAATFGILAAPLTADTDSAALEKRVMDHTLPNGIKLLILERHFSPTVSIRMMFRTGSVDEVSGKTGLAHMFEHMMFKGTKTLGTKNYAAEAPLLQQIDELHQAIDREKDKGAQADQKRIGELIEQVRAVEEKANALLSVNELWNL